MSRSVVVIGDALLDIDVQVSADRLVPDSAGPVLDEQGRSVRPGGAALAAVLAARDEDVEVTLAAPIADDADGVHLREQLGERVRVLALPTAGATAVKMRLRRGGATVARLDRGGPRTDVAGLPDALSEALAAADAVLVSDYGRGVTASAAIGELLTRAASGRPLVWDPHPRGATPVRGARLVTPNAGEAAGALGDAPAPGVPEACGQARRLVERWAAAGVAVTLGSRGAVLATDTGGVCAVPVHRGVDGDACGAGDRFAARAVTALAAGAVPSEAVAEAVRTAADFLARGGVAALDPGATGGGDRAVAPAPGSPEQVIAAIRERGGTVVATGGCFDLLHAGHLATLAAARALGDGLVVCLNSDASVRRRKGDGRPLQHERDRAEVLLGLRAVDAVVIFDDDTPERVLARLRPDIWVKGGDYTAGELPETPLVRSWGGEIVTVPYIPGRSTSRLVELARS